ncbi:Crp/Fnr family transcriptional regulator [Brevibacillus daliensis]|uniref:Crp/Fnr family transcriptional regulator n=1 Tax=Brevibacillus daliensis TaxID=2892995 RepID=UPI001E655E8B|nr:Crp/Fnr family transcriptional regulator [Brevibacillus daliensis]
MEIQKVIAHMESKKEIYQILKHCPYEILRQWKLVDFKKGAIMFSQDERYDYFSLLVEGTAEINIMGENGKKYTQAIYQVGDMIGEIEIYDLIPFVSTVEAIQDVTLIALQRDYFLTWLQMDHNFNQYFIRKALHHNYVNSKREGVNNLYSLNHRLCHYLLECVQNGSKHGDGIVVNVNKLELSQHFAVTQRSINRILSHLREKKILDVEKNRLMILDVTQLQKEAKKE